MDGYEFASKIAPSVLDFLGKLAWPVVVMYVLAKQKSAVGALFARLEELQIGSAKAKFEKKVEAVAEKAEALEATPLEPPQPRSVAGAGLVTQAPNTLRDEGVLEPSTTGLAGEPALTPSAKVGSSGHAKGSGDADLPEGKDPHEPSFVPTGGWHVRYGSSDDKLRASGLIITEWNNLEQFLREIAFKAKVLYADSDTAIKLTDRLCRNNFISLETSLVIKELGHLRNQVAHSKLEPTKESADTFAETCRRTMSRVTVEYENSQITR